MAIGHRMPCSAQNEAGVMLRWRRWSEIAFAYIKGPFRPKKTYSMTIVRRYADANGSYVGELYLLGLFMGTLQYSMIGVSLDTLPLEAKNVMSFELDVENDFLKPMPKGCVRVGAQ